MSRTRLALVAFLVALALAAMGSSSALAVTAGWMLNGTMLSAEGRTSAALATEVAVDNEFQLSGGGLEVGCETVLFDNGTIKETNDLLFERILFNKCNTQTQNCAVPTAIGFVPVLLEFTLDGALNVKAIGKPETGTTIETIKFSGEACSVAGVKSATGEIEFLVDEGQEERTHQLLLVAQPANGLLKFNSNPASLSGDALILLANDKPWSFL